MDNCPGTASQTEQTTIAEKKAKSTASRGRKTVSDWRRTDPDVGLMLDFQNGNQKAFDELVKRNTNRVHGVVSRFITDPALVEDLTQETFLRVFRASKRYTPTAKFSTFLYRIAANLSFNAIRSMKNSPTVPLDGYNANQDEDYHRQIPDHRIDAPGEHLSHSELATRIAEAIESLPKNQRIAIILNKYEDSSYKEIARVLGCSPMAVKSLLSRARCSLRDTLKPYLRR